MKCVPVEGLLAGGRYVLKGNPWMKINPAKAKTTCVIAKAPYFARAWGGERPIGVKAMNLLFTFAAEKLREVNPDARTDVIGYYMEMMHEWLRANPSPTKDVLERAMADMLKSAIDNKLGETTASLDDAIRRLKDRFAGLKKKTILARRLPAGTLVAVATSLSR